MGTTTSAVDRLYTLMGEHAVDRKAGIPTPETLVEIESAMHGLLEFLVVPTARAVVNVANEGKANSISYEDIGRLVVWADLMYDHATSLAAAAAKVTVAAREAFPLARGFDDEQGIFDSYGEIEDSHRFKNITQRFAETGVVA